MQDESKMHEHVLFMKELRQRTLMNELVELFFMKDYKMNELLSFKKN